MMKRIGKVERKTNETSISLELGLDNDLDNRTLEISTGIGFLDHVRIHRDCEIVGGRCTMPWPNMQAGP